MKLVINKPLKSAPIKVDPITKEISTLQSGVWKSIKDTTAFETQKIHGMGKFDSISLTGKQLHEALNNLIKEGLNVSYETKQYGDTYILYLT